MCQEDGDELYVDVKLDGAFQRMRVTTDAERAEFLSRLEGALGSTP